MFYPVRFVDWRLLHVFQLIFCLVFTALLFGFFHPAVCHTVCVRAELVGFLQQRSLTTTPHTASPRPCDFAASFLFFCLRWFVRIIILAFRRPILSFSLSFPPSVAPFTPHLTRTWSCLVRYIYQLAFRIYVLCTTTRSLRPLNLSVRLCACLII